MNNTHGAWYLICNPDRMIQDGQSDDCMKKFQFRTNSHSKNIGEGEFHNTNWMVFGIRNVENYSCEPSDIVALKILSGSNGNPHDCLKALQGYLFTRLLMDKAI